MYIGTGETWNLTQKSRIATFDGLCTVLLDWMHAATQSLGRPVKYTTLYKRWSAAVWLWYQVRLVDVVDALVSEGRVIRLEDYANGGYVLWERRAWDKLSPAERSGPAALGKAPLGDKRVSPVKTIDTMLNPTPGNELLTPSNPLQNSSAD